MSSTRSRGAALLRGAAAGALLGAGWGVLARVWMRTISTDPEFTWSGTLFIVGAMAFAGCLVGLVRALRLTGSSSGWKLLLAPAVLPFAGPGLLLLPGAALGGWALSGRGPRPLRVVAAVVTVVVVPLLTWFVATPEHDRAVLDGPVVVAGLALVQGLLAWGASEVFRRHEPRGTGADRVLGLTEGCGAPGRDDGAPPRGAPSLVRGGVSS